MLTPEDFQTIQNMIAQATSGPDRTGSGLSRKSLKDALRKANSRNPRRLDTHYVILDGTLESGARNPVSPYSLTVTQPPGPGVPPSFDTQFITCEQGRLTCFAIFTDDPLPELDVEIWVNGVLVDTQSVTVAATTALLITLNVSYNAGDRIGVALVNQGPLVSELFADMTLLREERFVS